MTIRYFLPVIALLATCCTPKEVEQAGPVEQEVAAHSITAYIDNGDGTRTGYVIDNEAKVARFNWLEKDLIDVTAWTGEAFTSVVFEAAAQGQSSEFSDGTVEGETTYAELLETYPEADLADWAFYPSRADLGLKIDDQSTEWIIRPDTEITCILPSNLKANAENPLAVVPLMGLKDDAGDYAFKPATSVFGIPVKNLTPDMDFISLSHETAALCGAFRLVNGQLAQDTAYESAGHEITISFSGIDGDFTFYFPIVGGSIPAGLTIRCGNSADPEGQMVLTTKGAFTLTNGRIGMCPALTFQPVDQLWEDYADAEYIDNLIWGYHESYTDGQTVPVKVERSGLFPEKYRFNNPYTVANELFGYTPYTDGIEGDDYFEFRIADGVLSYRNFVTGVEDKDANGHPMVLNYRSAYAGNTYVVSQLADGSPVELLFGCFYRATDDDTYFYTKDGSSNQQIHLYINQPEKWIEVAQGEFIDTFLWGSGYHNWGESRVPVTLQQNSADPALLRIPNPYLIAAEQFNYTPYSDGITGDEFIEITLLDEDLVRFKPFLAGIEDKASGGRPMKVWYPSDWIDDYDVSYNKVLSWRSDGLPAELQLAVVYSDPPISQGYMYTKNTLPSLHFYFPEPEETWVSVGTGRYTDEWFWKANAFPPYDVEVEIERSSMDPNRYRINNPYTVANSVFRRTPAGDADEYMYLQIDPESNVVSFGTLVTGMTRDKSGSIESNSGEVNWGIADTDASPAITGKSVEASRVIDGTASAPRTLQLYSAYYDSADYSYFYTASTGYKYLWFPAAYEAETWSSFCNGTYKDNIYDTKINGSSTLGTVTVDIQQSSLNSKRFRIANPYTKLADYASLSAGEADDYLYLQYGNGLVWFDTFRPGLKMDSDSHRMLICHPVASNINGWTGYGSDFTGSSVLSELSDGTPTKVQLGANWLDALDPASTYCYTRGGNYWSTDDRIVITFNSGDKAVITPRQYPMITNFHNPVEVLTLPEGTLDKLVVKVTGLDDYSSVGLRLYQYGWMDSDYITPDSNGIVTMTEFNQDITGPIDLNCWLTDPHIGASIRFLIQEVVVNGVSLPVMQDTGLAHYGGIIVNNGGDVANVRGSQETISAFRIPALVTSNKGTLIAAYDVRYKNSADLVADIDVGFKRSTDGGKTWSKLGLAMDMGEYGGLSQYENGIGDPCLLVDENTGDIFCFAVWAHGHGSDADSRSLAYAGKGYEIADTPQFMMVKSSDDGLTWSEPINITKQLKKYDWRMTFQGPGRGITMSDGTLVIPMQHQEGEQKIMHGLYPLNSGIAYSTDHGLTWHTHNFAHPVTSECTVAEIEPGVLLLSMRDETDSHYRRNYVTTDLGMSWTPHTTNGKWCEPTCEASMIHVNAGKNSTGKDLLLFCNPNSTSGRSNMSIRASYDNGESWDKITLIDEGGSWGYSCVTMIDESTVGVLYESSRGNILFQAIPLVELVK